MWSTIKQKILQLSKATGVEVIFTQEHKYIVHIVCLTLRKNKIIVERQVTGDESVLENLPKSIPLFLTFNGKGVLVKKVPVSTGKVSTIEDVLPESNPNDFYHSIDNFNGFSTISIARKSLIDEIIDNFRAKGFKVLNVSIGFKPVMLILPHLNQNTGAIKSSAYQLEIQKNEITDFEIALPEADKQVSQEFIFSEQYIADSRTIALGTAVALLTDHIEADPDFKNETISSERSNFKSYLLFRYFGWALLIGLLGLLLINFFIFNYYAQKNNEQETVQRYTRGNVAIEETLRQKIQQKEKFLEHTGWLNQYKTSYFADRIASLLPADISLTSMHFNPLGKTGNVFKGVSFKMNVIEINGDCSSTGYLNQFMNNLKSIQGVKNASVINYTYNKEKVTGSFILEILTY